MIDKIIDLSQKLGNMSASAIFALVCVVETYYIWKTQKDATQSSENWRGTREKQIASDVAHTEAIKTMADKIGSLEMALIKYLIKE